MKNTIHPRISVVNTMKALSNNEFLYYFQPIVSLKSGRIRGAEALLRWQTPTGLLIKPDEFVPQAERYGLIAAIFREMYPRLVNDLGRIVSIDSHISVSLNLSAGELASKELVRGLRSTLEQNGVPVQKLHVELLENVFMQPQPILQKAVSEIADQGFQIIMDDFSAGFTSLKYLSQLPLAAIKLSKQIVQRALGSKMDFQIVRHLVSMGHQLEFDIIAEGVETREIYDLLLSTGCDFGQGYYFGKPLPLSEFLELLQRRPRWLSYPFGLEYLAQFDHIDFRRDVMRTVLTLLAYEDKEIRQNALARLHKLDLKNCWLSKLRYGRGQRWYDRERFKQFKEIHKNFHEVAKRLIQAAINCEPWDQITQLIEEFSILSEEIMDYLQFIEKLGLIEHYSQKDDEKFRLAR